MRRFIIFHGKCHPRELGAAHLEAFSPISRWSLIALASTQNQAKCALLFLDKEVPETELPWLANVVARRRSRSGCRC
ncbi:MAG: hypothetical protein U1F68_05960 [Gammaproteobacteria bacterium]